MADPVHQGILEEGVDAWNEWRRENPTIIPQLSRIELRDRDLCDCDFIRTNLLGSDLSGADLRRAKFYDANLGLATLDEARLDQAQFCAANLGRAKLRGACLRASSFHAFPWTGTTATYPDSAFDLLGGPQLSWDLCDQLRRWAQMEGVIHSHDFEGIGVGDYLAGLRTRYDRSRALLSEADLSDADLTAAVLLNADLTGTRLERANLQYADLGFANLVGAKLAGANLRSSSLEYARFYDCDLRSADLSDALVHGSSSWRTNTEEAIQQRLVVTRHGEAPLTVDNLQLAHFIYLLLENPLLRQVVDAVASKAVLILGSFRNQQTLAVLREAVRSRDHVPIVFDFAIPSRRTTIETVSTLARLAKLVIADLTDARSVLQELQEIVPNLPSVPVRPLLLKGAEEPGMFDHLRKYPWVQETIYYDGDTGLKEGLDQMLPPL